MRTARKDEPASLLVLLYREQDALDALVTRAGDGPIGPERYDALEDEASGIADRLRAAFRTRG